MKLSCIWVSLLLVALAAACGTTSQREREDHANVTANGSDPLIEHSLDMLYGGTFRDGEVRRVELTLRNKSGKRLEGYFTVDWNDAAGKPIERGAGGWSRIALDPGASQPIRIQPMPQGAEGWRLRFSSTDGGR